MRPPLLARHELDRWLHAEPSALPTERSDAGLIVASRTLDRHRRRTVAGATRADRALLIDGKPEPFTLLWAGSRWVVVRRGPRQTVTVAANEIDPDQISLNPLTNPVDALLTHPGG